jgi:hypothetical protein
MDFGATPPRIANRRSSTPSHRTICNQLVSYEGVMYRTFAVFVLCESLWVRSATLM